MTPDEINSLRQKYNATIVHLHKPHPDLMICRVQPDFPLPAHAPGQYTTLGLGFWEPRHPEAQAENIKPDYVNKLCRRSYSISCSVLDKDGHLLDIPQTDWLEFYVVLVRTSGKPHGPVLTPRLFLLREGERVHLGEKITGNYTLQDVRPEDNVILLSTGTGEAPHNYMVWELLRRNHQGKILAACCVRYRQDLAYREIHDQLMQRYPNYTYLPLTTREADSAGHKVYIQDLILSGEMEKRLGQPLDPSRTHVFLCGNPKMIGAPEKNRETGEITFPQPPGVIELLTNRGFQTDQPAKKIRGNLHFEEYW